MRDLGPPLLRAPTIRNAVFLGFGIIFGLWILSGFELVRRLREVENRAGAITARFNRSEELLFVIRAQILLSSILVRDALLDTGAERADDYSQSLEATRREAEQAIREYVPLVTSQQQRENFARLVGEIQDYWRSWLPVIALTPERRAAEGRALLRRQVIPKRESIIHISEQLLLLNRQSYSQEQTELASVYRDVRRGIWWTSGLAVLLGLVIAVLVTRYSGQLEERIRIQRVREQETRRDLQRLSAQLVRAQEEERRVIARELHDEIGQVLTALKMELARVERNLEPASRARGGLQEARSIVDRAVHTVRDLSQLLHPAMLDDLGLPETLDWHLRGYSQRTGIRTELIQDRMAGRLPPEVEVCSYRIIQEALTNVARHAQATFCRVYLQRLAHTFLLTVEDDGQGFEPQALAAGEGRRGLGLIGIQERVAGLGGTFRLESHPGKGTRLSAELPALAVPPLAEETEPATVPPDPTRGGSAE